MKVPSLRPIDIDDLEFLMLIKQMLEMEILNIKQMVKVLEIYHLD